MGDRLSLAKGGCVVVIVSTSLMKRSIYSLLGLLIVNGDDYESRVRTLFCTPEEIDLYT